MQYDKGIAKSKENCHMIKRNPNIINRKMELQHTKEGNAAQSENHNIIKREMQHNKEIAT